MLPNREDGRSATERNPAIRPVGAAALLVASLTLTLLLIEGGARLFVTFVTPNVMLLDEDLGWSHRPNAKRTYYIEGHPAVVETNALGLRGKLYNGRSTKTRVLILGDSFADGLEVSNDELFSVILDNLRPDLEIINAGVGGYSTVQQFLVLERLQPKIHVDECLLMTFENDLVENIVPVSHGIGPQPFLDDEGRMHSLEWKAFAPLLFPIPAAKWLHQNSVAAYLLRNRVWIHLVYDHGARYMDQLRDALPEDKQWELFDELVGTMAAKCPLTIVAVPRREHVQSKDKAFSQRLRQVAQSRNLRFVDLQETLLPQHFYTEDIHWNVEGHRSVAEHLGQQLPNSRPAL